MIVIKGSEMMKTWLVKYCIVSVWVLMVSEGMLAMDATGGGGSAGAASGRDDLVCTTQTLIAAAKMGRVHCIEAWRRSPGFNVNVKDHHGWTALHYAAEFKQKAVVECLLNVPGVDVNIKTPDRYSPLDRAVIAGCLDIVSLLIKKGAKLDHKSDRSWRPLHFAAMYMHKDVAEALIAAGAQINKIDNWGKIPYAYAYNKLYTRKSDRDSRGPLLSEWNFLNTEYPDFFDI
jgi:ankyrin repeat protein